MKLPIFQVSISSKASWVRPPRPAANKWAEPCTVSSIDTIPIAMTWLVMKEISLKAGPTCSGWFDVDFFLCSIMFYLSVENYAEALLILIFSWKKQLDLKGWGICMTAWPTKMASHEIHFWEGVNLSRWIVQWWFSTFYQITWEPRTTRIQFIQFHFADDFVWEQFRSISPSCFTNKGRSNHGKVICFGRKSLQNS